MGLVAAFVRARDEKGLREWPWHIAATPAPKCEIRFTPPIGGRCPCSHALNASRTMSPLASILASYRIERAKSVELTPSSAWPRPSRAFFPREDKATVVRVLSRSGKLWQRSRGRPFLSRYRRFQACVATARAASCEGGDDEHGILGRDAGFAYRACVRGDRRALAACFPYCGPWRRRCRPSRITRKTSDPRPPLTPRSRRRVRRRRGTSRRLTPQGAGVSRASAPTPSPGAPLTLRPRVIANEAIRRAPRGGFGFRCGSVSVSILTRTPLQNA
jgi:hypothetical protein